MFTMPGNISCIILLKLGGNVFRASSTLLLKIVPVRCDAHLQLQPEPGLDPLNEVLAHGPPLGINIRLKWPPRRCEGTHRPSSPTVSQIE